LEDITKWKVTFVYQCATGSDSPLKLEAMIPMTSPWRVSYIYSYADATSVSEYILQGCPSTTPQELHQIGSQMKNVTAHHQVTNSGKMKGSEFCHSNGSVTSHDMINSKRSDTCQGWTSRITQGAGFVYGSMACPIGTGHPRAIFPRLYPV
jgi:hypothetical protein